MTAAEPVCDFHIITGEVEKMGDRLRAAGAELMSYARDEDVMAEARLVLTPVTAAGGISTRPMLIALANAVDLAEEGTVLVDATDVVDRARATGKSIAALVVVSVGSMAELEHLVRLAEQAGGAEFLRRAAEVLAPSEQADPAELLAEGARAVAAFIDGHARRLAEQAGHRWDDLDGEARDRWAAFVHKVLNRLVLDLDGEFVGEVDTDPPLAFGAYTVSTDATPEQLAAIVGDLGGDDQPAEHGGEAGGA